MSLHDDIEACMARGWTDGLPVVPPYRPIVDQMLAALDWRATDVVAVYQRMNLELHAEHVAATAVMAGCLPAYGPLLRALTEALLDPTFNLGGVAVTTGGPGVLVVVSGPVVARVGFAHGANALGAGLRPNATVGRFANMMMRFWGLAGGALEEFGTIGHPGRLGYCLAESPDRMWPPFHCQLGHPADASVVTVLAAEAPNSVNNHYAERGEHILETIADCMAHFGATSYYYRSGGMVVMMAPEHAGLVARDFTRDEARGFLVRRAVRSGDDLLRIGRIAREGGNFPERAQEPGKPRSPLRSEEQLLLVEAGCAGGKFSAVIPGWVGNRPTSRVILES